MHITTGLKFAGFMLGHVLGGVFREVPAVAELREASAGANAAEGSDEPVEAAETAEVEAEAQAHEEAVEGARAYVREFVSARLDAGATAASVLSEFRVPADAMPPAAAVTAMPLDELAALVLCWVRACSDAHAEQQEAASEGSLWRELGVRSTSWRPEEAEAALVAQLGVGGEAVVVLDGLVGEAERAALCEQLTGSAAPRAEAPPDTLWELTTCDGSGPEFSRSWGLRPALLQRLGASPSDAMREVHARLCALYPEYTIAHMPRVDAANFLDAAASDGAAGGEAGAGGGGGLPSSYACTDFVANAPVSGDCFSWHVDADPSSFPPGRWLSRYGDYDNGAPGKPLFVSLLLYLDEVWRREWGAETLFVEPSSGAGVLVQPRPARAVLMHQDVLHRVSAPSPLAKRPRYSLVWKLIFVPKKEARANHAPDAATPETICRPEWGPPSLIGARRRRPAAAAATSDTDCMLSAKRACPFK